MNKLPKINRNYNRDMSKVSKNDYYFVDLTKTQRRYFMTEKTIVKASKIDLILKKRICNIVHLPPFKQVFKRSF